MNHTPSQQETARRTSQGSSGSPGFSGEHLTWGPESPVQPSLSRYINFVTHPIGTCAVILESSHCIKKHLLT